MGIGNSYLGEVVVASLFNCEKWFGLGKGVSNLVSSMLGAMVVNSTSCE